MERMKAALSAIGLLCCIVGTGTKAVGQEIGIQVKPVMLELMPRPGERLKLAVEVRSTSPSANQEVEALVWPLYQGPDGRFAVIDPETTQQLPPPPAKTCLPWVSLGSHSFQVSPGGVHNVEVSIAVPTDAVGTYAAALILQTKPEPKPGTIAVRLRFLVPILIQVQGRVVPRKVEIRGASMAPVSPGGQTPPGTNLSVSIANRGESLATVGGSITLFARIADRWRRVTQAEIPARRILPDVQAAIAAHSPLKLPPGQYRLVAELTVDGSRLPQFTQELDYAGDPDAGSLSAEAELVVQPSVLEVGLPPGATRTTTVRLQNRSSEPILLASRIMLPQSLQGVAHGDLRGEDLDATQWLTVTAPEGPIAPGREVLLRVAARLPQELQDPKAAYFATAHIEARSSDGKLAGSVPVLVVVRNSALKGAPQFTPSGRIVVVDVGQGAFEATARFANVGSTHGEFRWSAEVLRGVETVTRLRSLDEGVQRILPLETAVCSVRFNASSLTPGTYLLRFTGASGDLRVEHTVGIRVSTGSGGPQIEIIQPGLEKPPPPTERHYEKPTDAGPTTETTRT
jgi:P pilus assembly chaperone PapD